MTILADHDRSDSDNPEERRDGITPVVLDAEIVDERPGGEIELAKSGEVELVKPRRPVIDAVVTVRRQTVSVATHERTKTTAKGVLRNFWYIAAGTGVAYRRWQDAHGASRYERMMRTCELAGDYDRLADWESRDTAEKQRRHDRVMDWVKSPLQLVKALGIAFASVTGILLGLGVVLALGTGDVSEVIAPITGLITAVTWTAWFLAAYGATLLLGATIVAVSYLWNLGRTRATPPGMLAPAADPTIASIVPDESSIIAALCNAGSVGKVIKAQIKAGWQPRWILVPNRDGQGWRAQVQLCQGTTVEMLNREKNVIAHNLVRKPVEVWMTEPHDQAGVLDVWVADQGALSREMPDHPYLYDGVGDYFHGFPVGVDQRGDEIIAGGMASNLAFAGVPGSGKTSMVLSYLAGAALDPLVDIDVYVMAYNNDYTALQPVLRTYVMGDQPEHLEAARQGLLDLVAEVSARGKLLAELGEETKVTRALAARDRRLRPRVVVFDECQTLFRTANREDRQRSDEVKELALKVMSRARKTGITLLFVTPEPSADSLPRGLAKITSHRVCFAIGDHQGNDAILGTGAHKSGISATSLVPKLDIGIAMASGFRPKPGLVRSYHLKREAGIDQISPIVKRALALRDEQASAAIEATPHQERDLIADLRQAFGQDKRIKVSDLIKKLAAIDHQTYASWKGPRLRDELGIERFPLTGGIDHLTVEIVDQAAQDRAVGEIVTDGSNREGGEGTETR